MDEEDYSYKKVLLKDHQDKIIERLKKASVEPKNILDVLGINEFFLKNKIQRLDSIIIKNKKVTNMFYETALIFENRFAIIKNNKQNSYLFLDHKNSDAGRNFMSNHEAVLKYFYYKVKSIDKSIEFFGHKRVKQSILDSKEIFKIDKYLPNYSTVKSKEPLDVVTIIKDNKAYKFLIEDLEVVFPDIINLKKGYNPPIDRKIRNGSIVKITKKTNTDLKYGDRVTVKELMKAGHNRYCVVAVNNKNYTIEEKKLKVVKC